MTTDNKHRVRDTLQGLKTILLALLVTSLLILIAVYISSTPIFRSMAHKGETKSFDKLWSVQSDYTSQGLDKTRLLPEFIGYKLTGASPVGSIADRDSTAELYTLITPCLLELFGKGAECSPLSAQRGAALLAEAADSSEFIYLRYYEPVMFQLIYAYASGKLTIDENEVADMSDGMDSAYIREIIIIPDKSFAAHRFIAYATDSQGNYFEFKQDASVVASNFHIAKLSESGGTIDTIAFSFAGGGAYGDLSDTLAARLYTLQPLFDAELPAEGITVEPTATLDTAVTQPLMRLFGYNPDKLNGYVDENGVGVYYDSHSRIYFETGRLAYRAGDLTMGIGLDRFLGYSVGDHLSLFDKLTAIDNLIGQIADISQNLIGGDAMLCLGEVYTEDGLLIFNYFLTYDNIRISGDPILRAVLSQDTLYSFELSAQSYKGTAIRAACPSQGYILRRLDETGMLPADAEAMTLNFIYHAGQAQWRAIYTPAPSVRQYTAAEFR